MLLSLHVRDFGVIEQVDMRLDEGLNVLTGETGAGKSILIDALGLLLGERASPAHVRGGAASAYVEGVFSPGAAEPLSDLLREHGVEGDDSLIVSREIARSGRSIARLGGRAVPVRLLTQLGRHLVDVHSQLEHQSLFQRARQLDFLDRYAGLLDERRQVAGEVARLRALRAAIEETRRAERAGARELDLLRFQVDEIEAARLDADEEAALQAERRQLASAGRLLELAARAGRSLEGGQSAGALDLLGEAQQALADIAALTESGAQMQAQAGEVQALASDLARALASYADGIEDDPRRLADLEARLDAIQTLKRKYGDSVAEVLEFAAKARRRLEMLDSGAERLRELTQTAREVTGRLGPALAELSRRRRAGAAELSRAVVRELADLNMPDARFEVRFEMRTDEEGVAIPGAPRPVAFDAAGVDRVDFYLSVNPGQPPQPLDRVASGGEVSRILLGLKSVLAGEDQTPALVFDEIDIGVGARGGRVVGQKLARLARAHQVLCVTHLPTVAAFADAHFVVEKDSAEGTTVSSLRRLSGDAVVEELALMGGARGAAARELACDLLTSARGWKRQAAAAQSQ